MCCGLTPGPAPILNTTLVAAPVPDQNKIAQLNKAAQQQAANSIPITTNAAIQRATTMLPPK